MRIARPLLFFACLCAFTAISKSQPAPGGGLNAFLFAKGSPSPTVGGVDVTVTQQPTNGWKCTDITLRVIDVMNAKTLAEYSVANPKASETKAFAGFASDLKVRVYGIATFDNMGILDFRELEAFVTTK